MLIEHLLRLPPTTTTTTTIISPPNWHRLAWSKQTKQALDGWKSFFDNHAKYYKVGKVLHEPIPEDAPLPEPCDAKSEGGAR